MIHKKCANLGKGLEKPAVQSLPEALVGYFDSLLEQEIEGTTVENNVSKEL